MLLAILAAAILGVALRPVSSPQPCEMLHRKVLDVDPFLTYSRVAHREVAHCSSFMMNHLSPCLQGSRSENYSNIHISSPHWRRIHDGACAYEAGLMGIMPSLSGSPPPLVATPPTSHSDLLLEKVYSDQCVNAGPNAESAPKRATIMNVAVKASTRPRRVPGSQQTTLRS